MDVTVRVPALDKLLDYVASGVGAIAGPMLANWRASREGEARITAARSDGEVRRLEAHSHGQSLQVIAEAQAKARQTISMTTESGNSMVEISRDEIIQSIEFQGRKRLSNVASVVESAADELDYKETSNHDPNHDWTARFFSEIQDVSSEEMQMLWARVLAGEVQRPGSTSIQALSILRNLDQPTARIFERLCSACVSIRVGDDQFVDVRVPALRGNAAHNALTEYGLSFDNLNILNEHGLIIADYNSWFDYGLCVQRELSNTEKFVFLIPFSHQGQSWILLPKTGRSKGQELKLSGVALTGAGRDLFQVVQLETMKKYTQALMKFFTTEKLQMTKVSSDDPIRQNPA